MSTKSIPALTQLLHSNTGACSGKYFSWFFNENIDYGYSLGEAVLKCTNNQSFD